MTSRPTFGDFATSASRHLARALSLSDPAHTGRSPMTRTTHATEIRHAMSRIVAVLNQYVADITATSLPLLPKDLDHLTPWMRAAIDARIALHQARALLAPYHEPTFEPSLKNQQARSGTN